MVPHFTADAYFLVGSGEVDRHLVVGAFAVFDDDVEYFSVDVEVGGSVYAIFCQDDARVIPSTPSRTTGFLTLYWTLSAPERGMGDSVITAVEAGRARVRGGG